MMELLSIYGRKEIKDGRRGGEHNQIKGGGYKGDSEGLHNLL